jgi:hypothetical protein
MTPPAPARVWPAAFSCEVNKVERLGPTFASELVTEAQQIQGALAADAAAPTATTPSSVATAISG